MSKEPFMIQDIPGKGRGMIATRSISSGEMVLAEAPLFIQTGLPTNATVLASVSALNKAQQREFFSLANCHRGKLPPALGIFQTNALPCGFNDRISMAVATEGAIFLKGSMFNSSCLPNVNNYWVESEGKITFRAIRDISSGEELYISYCSCLADRETRQVELKNRFGFECNCTACSLSGEERKASDTRRSSVAKLHSEIGACGAQPSLGLRKVKLALRYLNEEGLLESHGDSYYYDGFQFYTSSSDINSAKAWAKKAWELACRNKGPDSEEARRFDVFVQNPRAHPSFGLLTRQKLSGPEL
ncbi:hypothetical protein WOLCODRAFT_155769 [Wolfiporia cocos MD-104 SS10]|uniref:SET domain-containing protein n=1 Tax=Wolfiporia cocos (strain MD-104) TaxID=742152 RepID=A0A2H3JGF9_WOLCO|nr:hypothetical protein WOLCODRAFT_155769 [Wolfiporia cocos MD-104 SS10]